MSNPVGRASSYTSEILEKARAYVDGGWEEEGDVVPQVAGLALSIGVHRDTIYEWAKDPEKQEFSDILMRVQRMQERKLVNGGLANAFNPAVTKMMLVKHGYSDKIEQDHTSSDKSMSPRGSSLDDFYAKDVPTKSEPS